MFQCINLNGSLPWSTANSCSKYPGNISKVPGLGLKCTVLVPGNISEDFDSLFKLVKAPINEDLIFVDHKVKQGESLWLIARKYNVRVSDIVSINKLSDKSYIRPRQVLKIPTKAYGEYRKSIKSASRKIYHTVRKGDSLSEIAERYRTSVRNIKKWNGMRSDKILIGQKLKIWVKN